jgi:ATP-dependent Clp protease ATP-binding subunit ClpX
LEEVGLTFEPSAITAIAEKTLKSGTGARGLRAVIEETLRELLFELPSRTDVREVVVTKEAVEDGVPPLLVLRPEAEKKEA